MRLAALCGITVASVSLVKADAGWQRRMMVSALTMLRLDEMMARYASYADLADIIRHRFVEPQATLRELFARIVFNILSGNTDDHARTHAAFWNGEMLSLTPAYDICPQGRAGQEATQAMLITGDNRASRVATCFEAAHHFLLSQNKAMQIVEEQMRRVAENWIAVCDEAGLFFWERQFLNPYAFTTLEGASTVITELANELRKSVA